MDLNHIFNEVKKILQKHSTHLDSFDQFINSKAKEKKDSYHLYGKNKVELFGKNQKVFFAGIIKQKNYVGFYFSPLYSDPEQFNLSTDLKKALHGKTCFYIKDFSYLDQIEELLIKGKRLYQEKGWI